MDNKQQHLDNLIKRNQVLKPIVFKSFRTEKELDNYSIKIQNEIDEYYDNQEQIQKLEYELMTPEEQKRYDKGMEFLRLKAKGEPFDIDEFDDL